MSNIKTGNILNLDEPATKRKFLKYLSVGIGGVIGLRGLIGMWVQLEQNSLTD
ncbi:hypothetical protein ACEU6E_06320 [Halorutilales archaeon Cl-col2-1]